jgi:hypothetical protein
MMDTIVELRFEGMTPAEANLAAKELRERILDTNNDGVSVNIKKDSTETMDAGSILVMALQTASVVSVAGGIAAWLRARGATLKIRQGETEIVLTGKGAERADVSQIVAALGKGVKRK